MADELESLRAVARAATALREGHRRLDALGLAYFSRGRAPKDAETREIEDQVLVCKGLREELFRALDQLGEA